MKLKENLYTVVSKDMVEGGQSFVITLNSSCSIYAAHFPGMPITPGVCMIQLVEELLEELIGCSLRVCAIKNAKFLSVLKPEGQNVIVTLSGVKVENEIISSQAIISDFNSNVYARISLQTIIA